MIDGFINNEELFDFIFLTIAFIFIEILFFIFFKKIFNWNTENKKNTFFLIIISIFFYLIWNQNILYSYVDLILYISFLLVSSVAIKLLVNKYKYANFDNNEINFFYLIFIFSIFLSALLYEINFSGSSAIVFFIPLLKFAKVTESKSSTLAGAWAATAIVVVKELGNVVLKLKSLTIDWLL